MRTFENKDPISKIIKQLDVLPKHIGKFVHSKSEKNDTNCLSFEKF